MTTRLPLAALSLATALLPEVASAQLLTRVAGVFNVIVGLLLTAAFILYITGMILWFTRLGVWPSYRDDAIHMLEWSTATMFVLVILLIIVHFIEAYPVAASLVFGVIVVAAVVWLVAKISTAGESEDDGH